MNHEDDFFTNENAPNADAPDANNQSVNAAESRRQFLRRGAVASGSLVLGLAARGVAEEKAATSSELVLKMRDYKDLSRVGGFQVIATKDDKIIVARTEESVFVACSAICTHRGCQLQYEHSSKQFICPCHGARFNLNGQVARGPATRPLKSYKADSAAIIKLTPK